MNNTLVIVIVVVIVLAGGWFFFSSQEASAPAPAQEETTEDDISSLVPAQGFEDVEEMVVNEDGSTVEDGEAKDVMVTYTDDGYSPATVEINVGDTVTWKNESSGGMWTASIVHPTHTVYPEKSDEDCLGSSFDACDSLPAGESWSFTFTHVGEWGYHNHLNASKRGVVVVQ